ncbi:MAG: cysteine desulfurase family protein [Myxococcota bacterium]
MSHDALPIYLDHNATTPILPDVVDAMLPFLREHFGNPSSGHVYGRRAHGAVERARGQVAALLGASPEEIVFTSGGTEANNLAIRGVTGALDDKRHVVTSEIEHPATTEPCRLLERRGWAVEWLPVDGDGRVRPADLAGAMRRNTALVTIMHANNETGSIQPIREVSEAARRVGALVHTDAAQSLGKVPVDVADLGVDLLSVAGHKLYAPKGVGALYVRAGTPLEPVLRGAGHEGGLRPGTENVASIVGLGAACEIARAGLDEESTRLRSLSDLLQALLRDAVDGLALNGHPDERLPNTINARFPGVRGSALLAHTPQIAASTGSACHEGGGERPSAVLVAMGIEPEAALGSVRLSLGRATTEEEVRAVATALSEAWRTLTATGPQP